MRPLGILFVPNWRVRMGTSAAELQEPDRCSDPANYWFFRHFRSPVDVSIVDTSSALGPELQERFLHFYPAQSLVALRALRAQHYDALLCHGAQAAVGILGAARAMGLTLPPTVVFDVGCLNGGRPERRLQFSLTRWALERADAVIWHATASLRFCTTACPTLAAKGHFVPIGVSSAEFDDKSPEGDPPYAICVGSANRDWSTLLEAFRLLPRVSLLLVGGSGPIKSWPRNVRVLPRLPFREYAALVRRARLCILPLAESPASYGQMTLLQAFALGRPVIAADVGPIGDYLGTWTVAIPPADPLALAASVAALWTDEESRMALGRTAQHVVASRFTAERMAASIESIVLAAIRKRSP